MATRLVPKPCPFCGKGPLLVPWHGAPWMLSCENDECDVAPSVTGKTERGAITRWNKRAPIEVTP